MSQLWNFNRLDALATEPQLGGNSCVSGWWLTHPLTVYPLGLKNGHGNTCLACLINGFSEAQTKEAIFIELWNMRSVLKKLGVVIRHQWQRRTKIICEHYYSFVQQHQWLFVYHPPYNYHLSTNHQFVIQLSSLYHLSSIVCYLSFYYLLTYHLSVVYHLYFIICLLLHHSVIVNLCYLSSTYHVSIYFSGYISSYLYFFFVCIWILICIALCL